MVEPEDWAELEGGGCGMTLERITKDNLDYAVQIQEEIFPGESGRANLGRPSKAVLMAATI